MPLEAPPSPIVGGSASVESIPSADSIPSIESILSIDAITSADALRELRGEWEALWARAADATPFQHPAWLLAWWRHFGGGELRALTVRREGRLVAVFPLFIHTWENGVRQMTPVGNGLSDHVDLLAEPGFESGAGATVCGWLDANRETWDTADFRDLPADSSLLMTPLPDGIVAEVEDDVPCPVLHLPSRVDDLASAIPAGFLKKLRYYRRRVGRLASIEFEQADARNLDEMFGALVRLHAARWEGRGEPGVLDDDNVRRFHREVAEDFLAAGILRMYALRIDGQIAAVHHGFAAKGRAFYYLGGFDPAFETLNAGTLIVGHAIDEAVREGAREMDFLRGREPYKYAWGARDRPARRLRLRVDREPGR
jgi:CelD/BcsL family acetyltransferase involved in cellulose biosynthesis